MNKEAKTWSEFFKQIQEEMNSSLESILKEYKSICEEKELKNLKIA